MIKILRRDELVTRVVMGKKVLDIGFVDNSRTMKLHTTMSTVCNLMGIDSDVEGVKIAKEKGFNVKIMDAEKINLGETFDVIVACDIIEHLNNPGLFLKGVLKYLRSNGKLVITTPNPNYFRLNENGSFHTCRFSFRNLEELLSRYGFVIQERGYVKNEHYPKSVEDIIPFKSFRDTIYVIAVKQKK